MKNSIKEAIALGNEVSKAFRKIKKGVKKKFIERDDKIKEALKKELEKEKKLPTIVQDRMIKNGAKL